MSPRTSGCAATRPSSPATTPPIASSSPSTRPPCATPARARPSSTRSFAATTAAPISSSVGIMPGSAASTASTTLQRGLRGLPPRRARHRAARLRGGVLVDRGRRDGDSQDGAGGCVDPRHPLGHAGARDARRREDAAARVQPPRGGEDPARGDGGAAGKSGVTARLAPASTAAHAWTMRPVGALLAGGACGGVREERRRNAAAGGAATGADLGRVEVDAEHPGAPASPRLLGQYDLAGALWHYDQVPGLVAAMRDVAFPEWRVSVERWEGRSQMFPTLTNGGACTYPEATAFVPSGWTDLDLLPSRDWFTDTGQPVTIADTQWGRPRATRSAMRAASSTSPRRSAPSHSCRSTPCRRRWRAGRRPPARAGGWSFFNGVYRTRRPST